MYGYVQTFKPELKFKEYDIYRSYYCGLCHCLKEKYGLTAQAALNYDMVFLILLLTGLYEPETKSGMKRCIVTPKKHMFRINSATEYAADMLVLYTYFKFCDDCNDEKKVSGNFKKMFFKSPYKKLLKKSYGDKINNIIHYTKELEKAEKEKNYDYEIPAYYSGEIVSEIFAYKDDIWCRHLKKIGAYLGRFLYILDAYEDIEHDLKKKNYNPFTNDFKSMSREEFDNYCNDILMRYISECADEFEMLPIEENVEILRNILYIGIWQKFADIKEKRRKKYDGSIQRSGGSTNSN